MIGYVMQSLFGRDRRHEVCNLHINALPKV